MESLSLAPLTVYMASGCVTTAGTVIPMVGVASLQITSGTSIVFRNRSTDPIIVNTVTGTGGYTYSGSLTIVIPSIKDISEFSTSLFIDSEKGKQFIRDAENDISKLKINLK